MSVNEVHLEAVKGYLGQTDNTLNGIWDELAVWDYPAPGGNRAYADEPSKLSEKTERHNRWMKEALSIECSEIIYSDGVAIVEWVAHFQDKAVHNCTVLRFYQHRLILIREYFDFQRCPER